MLRRGEVSSPGGDYLQLPSPVATVNVTPSNIVSTASTAAAGTHLLLSAVDGDYDGLSITVNNGTSALPVIMRPANKNQAPRFKGETRLLGGFGQIWGCNWNNQTGDRTSRMLRLEGNDWLLAYNDFQPWQMGVEWRSSGAANCRVHRGSFYNQGDPTASNGGEACKVGVSSTLNVDLAAIIDWCRFRDFTAERETISGKSEGMHVRDCDIRNSRQLVLRHARSCIIERVRSDDKIAVQGPDHIIRNVIASEVEFNNGYQDGDEVHSGSSAVYLAAKRCKAQRITGNLSIGDDPFTTNGPYNALATDCTHSEVTGSVSDSGVNTSAAASIAAESIPSLTAGDVGVQAYRSQVTGA